MLESQNFIQKWKRNFKAGRSSWSAHYFLQVRGGQPFSVCVPKSAKSMTEFFRVPTKFVRTYYLTSLNVYMKSLEEMIQIHPNSENTI